MAVILDGNRRWARSHGHSTSKGYQHGGNRVLNLLTWCLDITDLEVVTLWPLSTENLRRPDTELKGLLRVIADTTQAIAATQRWRIHYLGVLERLPAQWSSILLSAADKTAHVVGPTVNIALAYGGHDEIARGVQRMLQAHRTAGTLDRLIKHISPADIAQHLDTTGQPDPDLVIRTSGEQRMSGFMPWQTAYTEYYFCPATWPDFQQTDLLRAVSWFRHRTRRYGQ
ncbi:polyprenyl diphosphate synthase [Nocardia sp. NRRL WC-3656]|uniref:polyprenyl diphosphate synthase n=1 Tax=Nocardia sp. NRRL WC-3656 TaxID=1463824 RepID=UPI000B1AED5C|nr:polyprenyl diphosphate synthase [Nocardia sp. NRRL WC-3656]